MKTKFLLVALCAVSLVGVGSLVYLRRNPTAKLATQSGLSPGDPHVLSVGSKLHFKLPPRPEHAIAEASANSLRSENEQEIVRLRSLAFDIAESTASRIEAHPGALSMLGRLHLRHSNPDAARELWDQAIALDPNYYEPYLDYGHLELNLGNFGAAQTYFLQALQCSPDLLEVYPPLVEVLMTQSKFEEAAAYAQKWLSREPQAVKAHSQLGMSYQQLGRFDMAVASFSTALKIDPTSREAAMGLMTAYRSQGDQIRANEAAQGLAELNASEPRRLGERNVLALDRIKMKNLLIFTAQRATQLLAQSGDVATAISQLEKANAALPEPQPLRGQLADLYLNNGRYDKALKVLREPCDRDPQDADAWMELALTCMRIRQLDAAAEALEQIIKLRPNDDRAYFLRAQTQLAQQRDVPGAVASARRALELAPVAANHYLLGTTLYHAKDYESAKVELRQALAMEPDNAEYRRALSEIP